MRKKQIDQEKDEVGTNGAAGHMNDALLMESNRIRDRIAKNEKNDVLARYEVAVAIHGLRDAAKYGSNAVTKLAMFLGWSLTTVQDYAKVAATWPDAQNFAELAAEKNKNGIPLTWSHFTLLMREEDTEVRANLMAQALTEGWTVAELEAGRKANKSGQSDNTDTAADSTDGTTEPATANPVVAMVNSVAEKLAAVKATCETGLLKTIAGAPANTLDETLVSLQKTREQVVALHKSTLDSLDTAIAQVEERRNLESKKHRKPAGKHAGKSGAGKADSSEKPAA